jgi:hypothetical protein
MEETVRYYYQYLDLQEVKWGTRTGSIWLGIGIGGGYSKCGNEPSGSIKCGEFLD